jgi:diaminohydroxyphosphoribosylaminopyrimidine deaminase/5-amino-6-(5-phosphoribosylamino)uracil reductase
MTTTDTDSGWMDRALELAARGRCGTSPNPMVGAVVLDAAGSLVGEGFHALFGGAHAEIVALDAAAERARGGTMYVTLEPCAHHGKTPPCTEAVVSAEILRVVVAMRDPNPEARGGIEDLRRQGVAVELCGAEVAKRAAALNRRWLRWTRARRPWVTLKAAVSLDGRIATRAGESHWITGEAARRRGHELREEHDAILVGVGTVLADNPRLTRRLGLNPVAGWRRVILDSRLRTPSESVVVRHNPEMTTIAHTAAAPAANRERLFGAGIRLLELETASERVDLHGLLAHLAGDGVAALLVEGGAAVHGSFADAGLVDEAVFFVAPMLLGGPAPSAVAGTGVAKLDLAHRFQFERVGRCGPDLELHAVTAGNGDVHGTG